MDYTHNFHLTSYVLAIYDYMPGPVCGLLHDWCGRSVVYIDQWKMSNVTVVDAVVRHLAS